MKYLPLIIVLIIVSEVFAQNYKEFHTKNGWHAKGEVLEHVEDEYYLIKTDYGKEFKIPVEDIELIKDLHAGENNSYNIIDPENQPEEGYLEVGASGLSPGRYNFHFGFTKGNGALNLTASASVFEIAGAYKALHKKNRSVEFMVPFGMVLNSDQASDYYTGILMKFWFYGFQVVPGYILPFNTTKKQSNFYHRLTGPKPLEPTFYLQAGFVFRFN